MTTHQERTQIINKLQKQYPGTRRQRSSHGCGKYSVQFFDKVTGKLVADLNLPNVVAEKDLPIDATRLEIESTRIVARGQSPV